MSEIGNEGLSNRQSGFRRFVALLIFPYVLAVDNCTPIAVTPFRQRLQREQSDGRSPPCGMYVTWD